MCNTIPDDVLYRPSLAEVLKEFKDLAECIAMDLPVSKDYHTATQVHAIERKAAERALDLLKKYYS
jgi:hypothetical protein